MPSQPIASSLQALAPDSLLAESQRADSLVADTVALDTTIITTISEGINEGVGDTAGAAIILASAFAAGVVLQWVILGLGRAALRKRDWWLYIRETVLPHMRRGGLLLIPSILVGASLPLVEIADQVEALIEALVYGGAVLGVAFLLFAAMRAAEGLLLRHYAPEGPESLRARKVQTQVDLLRRIATVTIIILATSAILIYFEPLRRIGAGLLTSAGIAGIVLGLAAQKTLGNLIAGIQIAFTQPIRVNDVVVVEGEWGRIEEITLTFVVVAIWDLRRLMLPISYFIEQPFQSWTRRSEELLGTVFLHLDHRAPIGALRTELERILPEHPEWDGEVQRVQVTETTERTITVRLLVSARNSGDAFTLRCAVREHMITFLQREHPYALPHSRVIGEENASTSSAATAVPPPPIG